MEKVEKKAEKTLSFPQRRRHARQTALQALYQWEIAQGEIPVIERQFNQTERFRGVDEAYFKAILYGVTSDVANLDTYIKRYIDRSIVELDPIELNIIRIGSYELLSCLDVPYRVIISEALELAKKFGAQDGHKFVNGVLDKIAHELRHREISQK